MYREKNVVYRVFGTISNSSQSLRVLKHIPVDNGGLWYIEEQNAGTGSMKVWVVFLRFYLSFLK